MSIKQDLIDGEQWEAQQRKRMGNSAYEAWVKSQETRYYTSFKTESEVKDFMRKAGYDYKRIDTGRYIYIKTHIGSDDYDCVWWLYNGDEIIAVINNDVDNVYVEKYMKKVESATGKKMFFLSIKERNSYTSKRVEAIQKQSIINVVKPQTSHVEEKEPESIPEYTFPTTFTDTRVLQQSLKKVGINTKVVGDNFEFSLDGFETSIYKESNNNYEFKIVGKCDLKSIHKYFNKIEAEYNKVVQYNICENIKSKVKKSSTMQLEQEEVLEDNSVLLTIRV